MIQGRMEEKIKVKRYKCKTKQIANSCYKTRRWKYLRSRIKGKIRHITRILPISIEIGHASIHKKNPRPYHKQQQVKCDSLANNEELQLH